MSNPYDKWRHPFANMLDPKKFLDATQVSKDNSTPQRAEPQQIPIAIDLPKHLYIPEDAQSVDIRRLANVGPATVQALLMSFRAPPSSTVRFIAYSVFSDGTLAANQEFIPRVNGNRIFPYHGDPNNNFRIDLGLGPDLSNANLIQTQLLLNPNDLLEWYITNTNAVAIAMGVRMMGYVDYTQTRVSGRSGG